MRFSALLRTLFRLLVLPALISTAWLYLYPAVQGCAFPRATPADATWPTPDPPPFRLLALGDPQLEGDTSLPDPNAPAFPSLQDLREGISNGNLDGVRSSVHDLVTRDIARLLHGYRKRLDLSGNDLYLAHIYRSVSWWTEPTHTVVLGDLLGSQWIGDEEFQRRTDRFWNRAFKGGQRAPQSVTDVKGNVESLGQDGAWKDRIIAVAGNHDIGYAGDIHEQRIARFEDAYGRVNWDVWFRLDNTTTTPDLETSSLDPAAAELHLIILNSMNLDDPAFRPELQKQSRDFVDAHIHHDDPASPSTGTILLTHIPLHKEAGVCVDPPFFSYFPADQGGGIKEQNHLSKQVSDHILAGLTKPRHGQSIVLNGHDHEGCDAFHHLDESDEEGSAATWHAKHHSLSAPEQINASVVGLREITVRSMMGSFGGNAGLLSAWFDHDAGQWKFEYDVCVLGVQHIWWAVHVVDVIAIVLGIASLLAWILEEVFSGKETHYAMGSNGKVKRA